MLDENLPTFHLTRTQGQPDHQSALYLGRGGDEPSPSYLVHHADPASPHGRNKYAAALFDANYPDILYGEVLSLPRFSQPTLSQEEIRRNNGIPPPPEPLLPDHFVIQLYNPDLQVKVTYHSGSLVGSPHWDFSIPQDTFRQPSSSQLDRSQNDPGADITTPKVNFRWKRESKLSKEMSCYVTGKSTDMVDKKKGKDPDITVALFKSLRYITIYEPNLLRVEMQDPKGLEVAFLLGAITIRDIWFGNIRQTFNISEVGGRKNSGGSSPTLPKPYGASLGAAAAGLYAQPQHASERPPALPTRPDPQMPITDARTQWEIDTETERLRYAHEQEQARLRRQLEADRRARERADEEETKRLRKMVEAEAKEARKKQKEVERETERLRRLYGPQAISSASHPQSTPITQQPFVPPPRPHSAQPSVSGGYPQYPRPQQGPSLRPPNGPSNSTMMSGALQAPSPKPKKSIWGLRGVEDGGKLTTKKSSVW